MNESIMHSDMTLTEKTEKYVKAQFASADNVNLIYHNLDHTAEVVRTAAELANETGLSDEDKESLLIAAWFHDLGYIHDYENHEETSALLCRKFLISGGYPEQKIRNVESIILATRMPQNPVTIAEQILCDADLSHTGRKGFYTRSLLLKKEWELNRNKKITDEEWIRKNITFISGINYFTRAAAERYTLQKFRNLAKLKDKLREMESGDADLSKNDDNKIKKERNDRGIETMFRNTMRTHVEFSIMADNKANIMISVNTLILTVIAAVMLRNLESNPHLIVPTVVLTSISLATLIFATLVTRPKITSGRFNEDEIKQKKANLLFFGNFFRMDLKMFQWGMNEMMKDKEYLYGSMIKDFYYLGQVLGQKYRYLRICYNLFMYGIIISVIAFTIALSLSPEGTDFLPLID